MPGGRSLEPEHGALLRKNFFSLRMCDKQSSCAAPVRMCDKHGTSQRPQKQLGSRAGDWEASAGSREAGRFTPENTASPEALCWKERSERERGGRLKEQREPVWTGPMEVRKE